MHRSVGEQEFSPAGMLTTEIRRDVRTADWPRLHNTRRRGNTLAANPFLSRVIHRGRHRRLIQWLERASRDARANHVGVVHQRVLFNGLASRPRLIGRSQLAKLVLAISRRAADG